MQRYKAIFLDFYGTLAFSRPSYGELLESSLNAHPKTSIKIDELDTICSWYDLCNQHNGAKFKTEWELLGLYLDKVWGHYGVKGNKQAFAQTLFQAESEAIAFPETEQFLNSLKELGFITCIVSNADNQFLRPAIKKNCWEFDHIISSEDTRSYKPNSTIFEKALDTCKLAANEVIHIGDSWTCDILGAQAMGLDTLWINRSQRPQPSSHPAINTKASATLSLTPILGQ